MKNSGLMRIHELEKKAGVPKTTIHFYVRNGLLHPPVKTGRTMAYYDETHLKRLQALQELKSKDRLPIAFLKESLAKLERDGERLEAPLDPPAAREVATTTRAKDKKRQEIARAAIKIISEKGYHQVKIRDIQKGIDSGVFRKIDPDLAAYALTGLIQIMCLRTTIGGDYSFEKIMDFLSDFMMKGLWPNESTPG
ncbi:MAG: MerR family transcriptional regulator [Syntrophobacteraceae bacterium]